MEQVAFTTEMAVVLGLLGFTVLLSVSEVIRVDLAAILILVVIGVLSYVPGLENLADVRALFDGFASKAVISIIAVMIVGAGLDKTGLMNRVAAAILKPLALSKASMRAEGIVLLHALIIQSSMAPRSPPRACAASPNSTRSKPTSAASTQVNASRPGRRERPRWLRHSATGCRNSGSGSRPSPFVGKAVHRTPFRSSSPARSWPIFTATGTDCPSFLHDGRVEIDSNGVENLIRPIANGWSLYTPFSSA